MIRELEGGEARAESYWAEQLAFGPVLVHALGLRLRHAPIAVPALVRCVELAHAAFGSLPEPPEADPVGLRLLANRQARALGWRRRAMLCRLLVRLGATVAPVPGVAPPRLSRCYPLSGFRPDERLVG